jgi:hypothetical protein
MDFLIGVLLVIIVLLLLFNFSSITISDTKYGGTCARNNSNGNNNNIPSPIQSALNKAVNGKINIDDQTYDYRKYFFVK